ncbi:MAG: hypothetical protein ACJ76Y_17115 [Thermoanaerobaculia bacterium]
MKKADPTSDNELRPEYRREDLGTGVRGKHYEAYVKEVKEDLPKRPQRRKLSATSVVLP